MRMLIVGLLLCLGVPGLTGCGGGQERVDKDGIRQSADQADRDLDRESAAKREREGG